MNTVINIKIATQKLMDDLDKKIKNHENAKDRNYYKQVKKYYKHLKEVRSHCLFSVPSLAECDCVYMDEERDAIKKLVAMGYEISSKMRSKEPFTSEENDAFLEAVYQVDIKYLIEMRTFIVLGKYLGDELSERKIHDYAIAKEKVEQETYIWLSS